MPALSPGPGPLNNSISPQDSPHPHEFIRVLNTITEFLAASESIRRDERENSRLPTATLDRVSALSESLRKEVMLLPLSTIPALHAPLKILVYELIFIDIQHILSSLASDPVEISDDTVDRRLDDFQLQFQEALDLLTSRGSTSQQISPNRTPFFPNSNVIISGGIFNTVTSNVVHDPVVREQSHKILRAIYIQYVVLFA